MAPKTGHFIGRSAEIAALDALLNAIEAGEPAALVLTGEPGIGKTRLLAELGARADARGQLVLSGSASELENDLPFSAFVDALDEYLRGLDPEQLASLDDDVRTELAQVFPSLTALGTAQAVALQHERYRSHRAVRALLEELASAQPLVLALDDLHWADSASLELFGALLRRPPAGVLLATTVRPHQVPERLAAALSRAERDSMLTRVELGPLTVEEAESLVGDAAGALYGESGGNPFYLEQLARAIRAGGRRGRGFPGRDTSPRLGRRGPHRGADAALAPARLALEGAAVAGDPFEPELAAAAAELPETSVMDALDELLRVDLVRPTDVPRRFRFRHPLVRRAVYEATPAGWRLGAHERCAAELAARGAPTAARAHHVERFAREGDLEAVAVLREAGDAAVRLAPGSAAHWFANALRLLPPAATVDERLELLLARAGALTAAGRFADSHEVLLQAVALAPGDARVERTCAAAESLLGRMEEAGTRLETTLAALPDPGSAEAVGLLVDLGVNQFWRTRFEEMLPTAVRTVQAAKRLENQGLLAASLALQSIAQATTGAGADAEASVSEASAIYDSLADDELARHLEAGAWVSGAELYLDRYVQADGHAARALALCRSTGQGEYVLVLVEILGGVWRTRGKLAEAAELLDGGVEAARLLGNTHALVWNLTGRSSVALPMGDVELALATAQEAFDLCEDADSDFHSSEAAVELARALLETGRPGPALDLLLDHAGDDELALIAGTARAHALELLTRCRLALGDHAGAEQAAASAKAWAAEVRLPLAAAWAARATAEVELSAGDPTRAASRFERLCFWIL